MLNRLKPHATGFRAAGRRTLIDALEPRTHLAAEAYHWQNAAIKGNGFVNGIVYSPLVPGLAYAYTDMGGAYRYDSADAKWTPLNDWSKWNDWPAQNLGVEAMAVDPVDPNRVYMVIGTYNSPAGMLRSSDRGQTWQRTDLVNGGTPLLRVNGNGNGRNGGDRLAVDPNKPSNLWYGSRQDGLWRSTDSGASWTRVNAFPVTGDTSGNGDRVGIISLLIDKNSATAGNASQTLYASVSTSAASKIYKSVNGGASWAAIPGQPGTVPNSSGVALTAYPVRAALASDGATLYITYASHPGPNGAEGGAVYKVTNLGAATPTWIDLKPGGTNPGFGYSGIAIDPQNPSTLYISTLDRWWPNDEIYRSTNGGANWTPLTPKGHLDNSSAPFANTSSPHWLGDIDVDPFNSAAMTFTTGYGIYKTTNLTAPATAANPVQWKFFNEGLEQSAVLELVSPNSGDVYLFSAIGDRDGFRHADFDVSPAEGVLGTSTGLNRGTSDDIEVAFNSANIAARLVRRAPYVQYSNDNGLTWSWMSSVNSAGAESSGGNIALSLDGTRLLYEPAGTSRLRYATRTGSTWSDWTLVAGTIPSDGAELVADTVDPNTFFAFSGRNVWRSTNGGVTWVSRTTTGPQNMNWMRAVPGQQGHLVVSTGGSGNGMWRSTDGGGAWTRLASSAVTHAVAVAAGAAKPGNSYPSLYVNGTVSGQTGYFRSDDQGATWISISNASQQFGYITVLQADPRVFGRVFAGANGRSVLVGEPLDVTAPTIIGNAAFVHDQNPSRVVVQFSENVQASLLASDLVVRTDPGAQPVTVSGVSYDAATNRATFTLASPLANGDYLATIDASAVKDAAGNSLAAGLSLPFFVLSGDADRNRSVGFADLLTLARHYNQLTGATWADGDFTFDGAVNFGDLLVLAKNYGTNLDELAPQAFARLQPAAAPIQAARHDDTDDEKEDALSDVI